MASVYAFILCLGESAAVADEPQRVCIIGVGDGGVESLTSAARQTIEQADLLIGSDHTLTRVPAGKQQRLVIGNDLQLAVDAVANRGNKKVVVLASGDPLFYGIARYLCDRLGKDTFDVIPHVSSMQLAFARVKESWEEAFLTNLANHSLASVLERIRIAEKAGLFTSETYTPAVIAKELLDRGIDYFNAYVCENLGSPDERVTYGELGYIARMTFDPLNVLILVRKPDVPDRPSEQVGRRLFGNPDEFFLQSKPKQGLLTPCEVRAMALAELDLGPSSVVWDVGAGSGSVSVEAAQIAASGRVFAIEMDGDDHQLLVSNAERFGLKNLTPVLGRAPEAWKDLPDPDAVFIGGTGRDVHLLVEAVYDRVRPGGRIVVNVASVENVGGVHAALHRYIPNVEVRMINVARGTYQLERIRFDALNPTFLISAVKPG